MAFFENLSTYGNDYALTDERGMGITYKQLLNDADTIAEKTKRRCLVLSMCKNCIESVTGYVGFLRNEIIPILVNDGINTAFLNDLIATYHPQYVYLPTEKAKEIMGVSIYTYNSYTLLKLQYDEDYEINSDLALLLTTSGSTGSPKLVRQSYRNIKANTESIVEYLNIIQSDRAITTLPMNYTYGLSILNTHLYKGAVVVLTDASLMEQRFWSVFRKEKVTTFGGVPYTYEILKKLHFNKMALPDLRYITQAGGKLSKELAVEFIDICKKKNIQFIVMYGQTEATARMSYLPWEFAESKAGSIGIAIPGGRFWLEDADGNRIDALDTPGELVYQGENVTLGYAESRFDLEHGDDNRGVLHTGDMAKQDAEGFYYIVGRKKRFLKIFGNRVNLDEVESLLKKEEIDCVCSGTDDNLVVYVISENDMKKTVLFITEQTEINRSGFKVSVIKEIPRNESGKVLYSALA